MVHNLMRKVFISILSICFVHMFCPYVLSICFVHMFCPYVLSDLVDVLYKEFACNSDEHFLFRENKRREHPFVFITLNNLFCQNMLYNTVLYMVILFYTEKLCVFVIFDLLHIPLHLWDTYRSMEFMYICMHVKIYLRV